MWDERCPVELWAIRMVLEFGEGRRVMPLAKERPVGRAIVQVVSVDEEGGQYATLPPPKIISSCRN